MEFILPLPQQLDKNGVLFKQWANFSERFHCHRSSVSSNGPRIDTPSVLLFAANHHLKYICESLKMYDLDSLKLSRVLEIIEKVCLPSFLLLFERFRYFTLEQEPSESLSDYVNVMRKQVELCEFGDTKDSIMASTLANGASDEILRQTLQNTDSLCVKDAVTSCSSLAKSSETSSDNFTDIPRNNLKAVPTKQREMKKKSKAVSRSKPKKNVFVMPPLHSSLKEEMYSEEDMDSDDHIETVVSAIVKKSKMKLKKKSGHGQQTSTRPKTFLCFQCDNEYASRKSFRRHVASKHANCSEYYCKHCDKTFHNRSECITHCMGHNTSPASGVHALGGSKGVEDTEYLCWYCEERLPNLEDYKKHCSSHSAVRVFYCELCQRKNHTLIRMFGHLKGHLSPRHRCEICANCFGRAELLEAHMQTHAAQPIHQCLVCSKNFVSADRLQGHMRTHSGEKRFTCELCGKSFCQKMSLDYHKRVHAGEKPYECDVCGKKTASFGYLRKHKQMHSDKRPYVCEVCGKDFRFVSNLTRHRNGHSGKRAFACNVCGRAFIYREGLRDHIKASRCPGRRQEGVIKRPARAPRPKSHHVPNSSFGSGQSLASSVVPVQHAPETLLNELPHWQYMLRNNESDGVEGLVVMPQYY